MSRKPDLLIIDSTVLEIDVARRQVLSDRVNLLYYDCPTIDEFKKRMEPGGPYANIVAIMRNGWHKAGPLANQRPFAADVVPCFPKSLKLIACSGHGYDAADIEGLTSRGILYCNTPNACTEAVAVTALSLIIDSFRFLSFAQWCARYDWMKSRELGPIAVDPTNKTLGIVGLGAIGLAVAQKCEAVFGMKIHYQGPRPKPAVEKLLSHGAVYHSTVEDMIPEIDCIVLAAPYNKETHHLLSHKQFALAKKEGLRVVNIARGAMIDEDALIEALESGRVPGAGLDVHASEPEVNPKLKDNWKVALLPHIGVCSKTFFLVIGAGVVGLTTALELRHRYPSAKIVIAAKYLPGDSAPEYTSAWGGANWFPAATDNGPQQDYEAITYRKFKNLCSERPECGIKPMQIKWHYEVPIEEAGILTPATGKLWFEDLTEATRLNIEIHRRIFGSIDNAFKRYPQATAVFNCTGLGAMTLGGVEDNTMYPARGQILLVEGPEKPIENMYFRAPHRAGEATHIFPRGENGGVILGGCRQKNNWSGETDLAFAEVIKRRCCSLAPELGKPEDLKIIKHGVGLRPAREGGPRVESEMLDGKLVIHNYGAGGVGFQASWGLARYAVDLLPERARM
ncbi:D-amino-acid oxidase [Curvularia clavata]|uniref:D-amino-acid oxidase n=1 Tax=Curvularia clavata TaxID=95742 RepID=A0A9Q9DUV4_CURCL|nr:D-amino-acid oxidase [Curvularia clavata]